MNEQLCAFAQQKLNETLKEERLIKAIYQHNMVFITDDDKAPYLIKFVPIKDMKRLYIERDIAEYLKETTTLVMPKVILIGTFQEYGYLLREMVEGMTLEEALKTSNYDHPSLIEEAGYHLARLHLKTFDDKGIIDRGLNVIPELIYTQEEFNHFLKIIEQKNLLSIEYIRYLKSLDIDRLFGKGENVLCHADYHLKNIIVSDDGMKSVIDFEWMSSAPPYDDLAMFVLMLELEGYPELIEIFYKGYSSVKTIDKHYYENVELFKVYRLVTMIAYQASLEQVTMTAFFQAIRAMLDTKLNSLVK